MKMFLINMQGSYGAEDFYIVKATTIEEARLKATAKYEHVSHFTGNYMGQQQEIVFDTIGVSELITYHW